MAITKSAKKRIRSNEKKRVFNLRRVREMREHIKAFRQAITQGDTSQAQKHMPTLYQAIDKAAKRGVIKHNTAARKKSRLARLLASKET